MLRDRMARYRLHLFALLTHFLTGENSGNIEIILLPCYVLRLIKLFDQQLEPDLKDIGFEF